MPEFRHLREFFDYQARLSDRARYIVGPHWQALWTAWGRSNAVLPVHLRSYKSDGPAQIKDRQQSFDTFVRWQFESSGLDLNVLAPNWLDGSDTDAKVHFKSLQMEDLVSPKTFDRHPQLAIMASGGIDFIIALAWANNVLRYAPEDIAVVYVDYGSEHANKATSIVNQTRQWVAQHAIWSFRLTATPPGKKLLDVATLQGRKKVYRNAFLASVGSLVAPTVWVLAGSAQDHRADHSSRSTRFFADISSVLSMQHDRPVQVNSPFRHISKPDLYRWFIEQCGDDAYQMFNETSDCDAKSALACGDCNSCFKFVNMMLKVKDSKLTSACLKRFKGIQQNENFIEYCLQRDGYFLVGDETTIKG